MIRLKEQLRDVVAAGHPVDDMQRTIALRGLIPKNLVGHPDDLEDSTSTHEAKLRWVGRHIERAHVKAMPGLWAKARGLTDVAQSGGPAPAGGSGGQQG